MISKHCCIELISLFLTSLIVKILRIGSLGSRYSQPLTKVPLCSLRNNSIPKFTWGRNGCDSRKLSMRIPTLTKWFHYTAFRFIVMFVIIKKSITSLL